MNPQPIAVAVVRHHDRFLVGLRPAGVPLAGFWEFPGGKVEADESPADAAVRECREETGIEVTVSSEYPQQLADYDHGSVHLRFFDCKWHIRDAARSAKQSVAAIDNVSLPTPREPFRWVPLAALADLKFPPGNRRLLKVLLSEQAGEDGDGRTAGGKPRSGVSEQR